MRLNIRGTNNIRTEHMRLSSIFAIAGTFLAAAVLCWIGAGFAVTVIEDNSRISVRHALDKEGLLWAEVDADGLQVFLAGTAPSEATRFSALSTAGTVVDAARILDQMLVEDSAALTPPRFSVEILRNDAGISLIGLIPAASDRERLIAELTEMAGGNEVIDLLETADYPRPDTWEAALGYAVGALKKMPRAKISVDARRIEITSMTDSAGEKRRLEADLTRTLPDDLRLRLDISAPRPVITPFTLRFLIQDGTPQFDACSADTEAARRMILAAAREAGMADPGDCTIGLGVPTPQWGKATARAIRALAELGGGSITFADADISLIAAQGIAESHFDDVVGALQADLPDVFALHAVLTPAPDASLPVVPEFVATLSPEGLVQIRGRVGSERLRETVDSFAKARFSSDKVYTKARVAEGLPKDWPVRVLTGLETLSYLSNGAVTVTPDTLSISGNTGVKGTSALISGFLANKLGEGAKFDINVTYQEKLDPVASLPTPAECAAAIAAIQSERKIIFEPGSANINADGAAIMDDIAEILGQCGDLRIEIGGHTDSQGRDTMNQQLSTARARAVLDALRARRVLTSSFTAKGYGESQPIADNGTEEGREANRRIEFRLITPEAITERETALESLEEQGEEETQADTDEQQGTGD